MENARRRTLHAFSLACRVAIEGERLYLLRASAVCSREVIPMLRIGDAAPDLDAESSRGERVSLHALRGKIVVVYFFPKAFTPGCTVETKGFRDNYPELRELGAEVIGVSTDPLAVQCNFAAAHDVTFPMVGDSDKHIARAFGVLWPLFPFAKRVTFVLDEQGIVRHVFHHELQVSRHLDDVLRAVVKMRQAP